MEFSTMVLTMYVPVDEDPASDERILGIAVEQALMAAELGYNPWFTEHHFRGPWHSSPLQFASYIAPQISPERYLGFGVLSVPFYNPVRLVEGMNLLDQLTKGRTLYGLGSGWAGAEPDAMGIEASYHANSQAAEETLEIVEKLWDFKTGDPAFVYQTPLHRGTIKRRVTPSPYRKRHPTVIRTAGRDASVITSAQKGWPAFLGAFSAESSLEDQIRLYRSTLAAANHSQDVVEECLRWCTCDWLAVVVANTDEEAKLWRPKRAPSILSRATITSRRMDRCTAPSQSRRKTNQTRRPMQLAAIWSALSPARQIRSPLMCNGSPMPASTTCCSGFSASGPARPDIFRNSRCGFSRNMSHRGSGIFLR